MRPGKESLAASTGVRPTFINIGPGRCATSWLHEALQAHPEIAMARVKETEYFNTHFHQSAAWYENHFPVSNVAVGEISSNYYLDADVVGRISNYDPSLKLIINLRNPYTLLESFYGFGVRRGLAVEPLAESLELPIGKFMGSGFDGRNKKGTLTPSDSKTLLESVCLYDRLKPFVEEFDKQQIHFFVFENLSNYESVLESLYDFLCVDSSFVPEGADRIVNSSIKPKSKLVAKLATNTAGLLRSVGAYGILARLHKSELIKRVLFDSQKEKEQKLTVRDTLPDAAVALLDDQVELMKNLHPPLVTLWDTHHE